MLWNTNTKPKSILASVTVKKKQVKKNPVCTEKLVNTLSRWNIYKWIGGHFSNDLGQWDMHIVVLKVI